MKNKYSLFGDFPATSKNDWLNAAAHEIGGKNALQSLTSSQGALTIAPYYDQSDLKGLEYLENFHLTPSAEEFSSPRKWFNQPYIAVTDEKQANNAALLYLNSGADGLLFDLLQDKIDFEQLLHRIELQFCNVSFLVTSETQIKSLTAILQSLPQPISPVYGAFFWKKKTEARAAAFYDTRGMKNFFSQGVFIPSINDPVLEISEALYCGVQQVEQLRNASIPTSDIFKHVCFSIDVQTDFFTGIAKLKALRMLWYTVADVYDLSNFTTANVYIHVRSEPWVLDTFQPHSNMLKGTTAALAAILGGCNALTVYAQDGSNPMMNRVARNLSNILREESHLDKVADPVAGAYFADSLIHQIATKAWQEFTAKISTAAEE